MRLLSTALLLLCALPVAAANRQEAIPFQNLDPAQIDRALQSGRVVEERKSPDGGVTSTVRVHALFKNGAVAWSVDPGRKVVLVSGPEEAIQQVRALLRTLDHPSRPVRLEMTLLTGTEAALRAFAPDPKTEITPARLPENYHVNIAALVAQGKTTVLAKHELTSQVYQPVRLAWVAGDAMDSPDYARWVSVTALPEGRDRISLQFRSSRTPNSFWNLRRITQADSFSTVLPTGEILIVSVVLADAEAAPAPVK